MQHEAALSTYQREFWDEEESGVLEKNEKRWKKGALIATVAVMVVLVIVLFQSTSNATSVGQTTVVKKLMAVKERMMNRNVEDVEAGYEERSVVVKEESIPSGLPWGSANLDTSTGTSVVLLQGSTQKNSLTSFTAKVTVKNGNCYKPALKLELYSLDHSKKSPYEHIIWTVKQGGSSTNVNTCSLPLYNHYVCPSKFFWIQCLPNYTGLNDIMSGETIEVKMSPKGPQADIGICSVVTNGKTYYWVGRITLSCGSVSKCPAGQYHTSGKCHDCPAGYSCSSDKKTICPAGSYQPNTGKSSCIKSPCGKHVPAPGGTMALTCRAGTYSKAGASSCTPTPVGTYTGAGACGPTKCPKGSYQDCDGQSNCPKGPCGHFVDKTGATGFTPCPAGTYQPVGGQSSCLPVGPGQYSGVGHCKPRVCIPGYYQDLPGQKSCKPADCGKKVPNAGSNNQVSCGKGFYQPQPGQPNCIPIPAGYISDQGGCAIKCCPKGTFRNAHFMCEPAPCGSFVGTKCSSAPTPCPAGTYTAGPGATTCTPAPKGSIPGPNGCKTKKCPPGQYQDQEGQTSCKDAKCGYKAPNPGTVNPVPCPMGYFQDSVKSTTCKPCPVGSANNKVAQCHCPLCLKGHYQPSTGKTSCIPSPCGNFVPGKGATKVNPCPPGEYQDKTGQSGCIKAPAGKYAVGGTCKPGTCPPGSFTPTAGLTKCSDAPCGTFVAGSGASSPVNCVAGQYQPLPGQTKCLDAPTGSYTNGGKKCTETPCPAGSYQDQTGQQMCKPADCGHYVAIIGSANQNPCGPGRYQPNKGKTSCLKADVGYFAPGPTSCKQHRCPSGSYTDCNGQSKCIAAPCGSFVSGTGGKKVTPCPAGTYQDTPGQSSCKQTGAGSFSGVGYCFSQQCDPGNYQNLAGQSSCKQANCGNFVSGEGRQSQSQCPAKSYQPKKGQVGCLQTTHAHAPNPGTCESGTVAGGIYYPGPKKMTWTEADKWCKSNGDSLAIIRNAAENAAAISACNRTPGYCFLGGTDIAAEGTWKWVDGTPFAGNYQNWAKGEPNNAGGEHCLLTWTGDKWNDGHCHKAESFLCERRPIYKVCVEANGKPATTFGSFHVRRSGLLKSVKVSRVSGKFAYCRLPPPPTCTGYYGISTVGGHGFDLYLTRADYTKVLFPLMMNTVGVTKASPHRPYPAFPFYLLSGADAQSTAPITLTNQSPKSVTKGEEIRVYMGEVLYQYAMTDNSGRVCYNVEVTIQ